MNAIDVQETTKSPAQLQVMLANIEDLPTIPEILFRILKVLDDPDSGAHDLSAVVRLDAPLTAKILRLANSPYYAGTGDVTDIQRCVAVLGYRTVRQVAICVSVATSVVQAAAKAGGKLDYRELWRHSVVTGAVAKHLAELVAYPDPEEIFTAGLLHDLGKFVFEIHTPRSYGQVIRNSRDEKISLCRAETNTYGFDHATLGEAFGRFWNFPERLIRCIGHHHDQPVCPAEPAQSDAALALVALADYLANTFDPPRSDLGQEIQPTDPAGLYAAAGVTEETVEENLGAIAESMVNSSVYLDLS
jgi:putative nucleotidyltransferase with HDIG domain